MSVETDVLQNIPQVGQALITSSKLTAWKANRTDEIYRKDNRISGDRLDELLVLALTADSYIFLQLGGADIWERRFKDLLCSIQSDLSYNQEPVTITRPRLHKVGKLPESLINGD